jgi:transposase-like protein
MGRPTKLTPEIAERIAALVAEGNYAETAAECEGVNRATFYRWMEQGARDESGPFRDFRDSVTRARARAEHDALRVVREGMLHEERGPERAQWYLERTASDRFGRRDKVVVENAVREELDRALAKLEAALTSEEFDRVLRILAADGAGNGAAVATDDAGEAVH